MSSSLSDYPGHISLQVGKLDPDQRLSNVSNDHFLSYGSIDDGTGSFASPVASAFDSLANEYSILKQYEKAGTIKMRKIKFLDQDKVPSSWVPWSNGRKERYGNNACPRI